MKFLSSIFRSFFRDDALNLAANVSFCALLSIIPIAMLIVSTAGYILGSSGEAFGWIVNFATNILPVGKDQFVENLQSILEQRSSLGIIGLVFLIFIATILVASIERALDIVFKSENKRNFFHSRLLGVALIFFVTLLFSLPSAVQILEGLFVRYGFNFPLSSFTTGKVFFILTAFLAYLMTIVIIPNKKIYIRYAAIGGVVFALGIGVAKFIFRWYMVFAFERYNVIYGSLAAVVLLIVWIYYLAVTMLFSAELVSMLQGEMVFHRKAVNSEQ